MVERPIKKSERQAAPSSEPSSPTSDSKPSVPAKPQRSAGRSDDRASGRGKRGSQDDEPKQMTNPALMRGPKPVKAPIAPEPQPEAIADETLAETTVETTEE
jgi:hypothetical protein